MSISRLTPSLLESLKQIDKLGIHSADVSVGHIMRLHYLGFLENLNGDSNYISTMYISVLGREALNGHCEIVESDSD